MPLADHILSIAAAEIGTQEVNGTNCGPRVNQYKAATWLPADKPWPWCAAFICWVVREAMRAAGVAETKTFKRPRTAGAIDLENWSLAQDNTTSTVQKVSRRSIKPGDIITFKFSTGGHCGIATSGPDADGNFQTIEGNTDARGSREGGGVFRKTRNVSSVHGRIRFTI